MKCSSVESQKSHEGELQEEIGMAIYESLVVENERMKATLSYLASFNTRKRGE